MSSVPTNTTINSQLPAYLQKETRIDDKRDIAKLLSPPRMKIVQSQSGIQFKGDGKFKDGDILIIPQMIKIGDLNTEFTFVPLHFFPTYCCFNPWDLKDQLQYIREMSFDVESIVGKKALAFRNEQCPENARYEIEYRKVINVFAKIEGDFGSDAPEYVTQIFNKGEYSTGQVLVDLVIKRPADRYVQKYNALSKWKQDKKGSHYGLDIRNAPDMWVAEDKVALYRELHLYLKKMVDDRQVEIDMSDSDLGSSGGNAANETKY